MKITLEDLKYYDLEKVKNRLHAGEPAFVFRGADLLAPQMVRSYGELLTRLPQDITSADLFNKGVAAIVAADKMVEWQRQNPTLTKMPDLPLSMMLKI